MRPCTLLCRTPRITRKTELLWLCIGLGVLMIICIMQFAILRRYRTDNREMLQQRYLNEHVRQYGLSTTTYQQTNRTQEREKEPQFNSSVVTSVWTYRPGNRSSFLTIAIPSVKRPNTKRVYLYETLDSIINSTSELDRNKTRVVIFLTDFDVQYKMAIEKNLRYRYQEYFSSGFFSSVSVHQNIYPDLDNVKKTFNDSHERLKWRAKQNIDFAYMFSYSSHISQYYLQLEDDVISASDFVSDIETAIKTQNKSWFSLEFSKLGFIGKLFKSIDLKWISDFLFRNYDELPCDLMLGQIQATHGQKHPIHSNISLFQHIGKFSSLKDKMIPVVDPTFRDMAKANVYIHDFSKGDNPAARIVTDVAQYESYRPENAYDSNNTNYFWGKSQQSGKFFRLIFKQPQNISRIIIVTGKEMYRNDFLKFGELQYSVSSPSGDDCGTFIKLVDFIDGEVDTLAQGSKLVDNITCLNIRVKKQSKTWLIIWRIELFLSH